MDKRTIEGFISKYFLMGAIEAVKWDVTTDEVSTRFASEDKSLIGIVTTKNFGVPNGTYFIYETSQLRNLLRVLEDDITFDVTKKADGVPIKFGMSDLSTEISFALSDAKAIGPVPTIKQLPPFELVATLSEGFNESFLKATGALSDVEKVTISGTTKSIDVTVGYENQNTSRIVLRPDVVETAVIAPLHFDLKNFKSVIATNKTAGVCTLQVSSKGILHLTFASDSYTLDYYLNQSR